jgi:hypothetical protein
MHSSFLKLVENLSFESETFFRNNTLLSTDLHKKILVFGRHFDFSPINYFFQKI